MTSASTSKKRRGSSRRGSRGQFHMNSDSDSDYDGSRTTKRVKISNAATSGQQPQSRQGGTAGPSGLTASNTPSRPRRTIRRPRRYTDDISTIPSQRRRRRRTRTASVVTATSSLSGETLVASENEGRGPLTFGTVDPNPNIAGRCDENPSHSNVWTVPCLGSHPLPYFVCSICTDRQRNTLEPVERDAIEGHKVPICRRCATAEMQRRANGEYKLCKCHDGIKNWTRCHDCRVAAMNDVRVAARDRRDRSLRDGWREWMCGVCGTQLQGQRGGKVCLACLGIDVERGSTNTTAPPRLPTTQFPQGTTTGTNTFGATYTNPTAFPAPVTSGSQFAQGLMHTGPSTTIPAPTNQFTSQFPQGTTTAANPGGPAFTTVPGMPSGSQFTPGPMHAGPSTTFPAPTNQFTSQIPQGTTPGGNPFGATFPQNPPTFTTPAASSGNQFAQGSVYAAPPTSFTAPTNMATSQFPQGSGYGWPQTAPAGASQQGFTSQVPQSAMQTWPDPAQPAFPQVMNQAAAPTTMTATEQNLQDPSEDWSFLASLSSLFEMTGLDPSSEHTWGGMDSGNQHAGQGNQN